MTKPISDTFLTAVNFGDFAVFTLLQQCGNPQLCNRDSLDGARTRSRAVALSERQLLGRYHRPRGRIP